MHKTQILLTVAVLLGLLCAPTQAIQCRYCDQQQCRAVCKNDLDDCYQYQKDHKEKQPCLTLYYACHAACGVVPRSLDVESPANETSSSVSVIDVPPFANTTATTMPPSSDSV